ncbi:MAG: hypothetical protein FWC79_03095 [Oscillospiraceae bacterium]|nr:hypothetical protein [Oscillospiraceae bacterium]
MSRTSFHTVVHVVNLYIDSLFNEDNERTSAMIDPIYYVINQGNQRALSVIEEIEWGFFESEGMSSKIVDNVEVFFVKGIISYEDMDDLGDGGWSYWENDTFEENEDFDYFAMIPPNRIEFNLIVKLDYNNNAFSIIPINFEDFEEIEYSEEITTSVELNEHNEIMRIVVTDEVMATTYFDYFITLLLTDIERAFNLLDEEYREKRFVNLAEFNRFIDRNFGELRHSRAMRYQVTHRDAYTQFIVIDESGNDFIFRETAVMQFAVILDEHTLILPEFLEAFNATNAQGRVALNLQRFTNSLNHEDYRFAYSKLAPGFRNNNFPTLQSFESYIRDILPERMRIEHLEFGTEGNVYTYRVNIFDRDNGNARGIEKTFIIQLQEGTDFVISFNII